MSYKLSRFNYYTYNSKKELLAYNSYAGNASYVKADSTYSEQIESFLSGKEDVNRLSESMLEKLADKGLIVPKDVDEDQKLKLLRFSEVVSPVLNLIILPTGQCNFRCVYCYESFEDGAMSKEVQAGIIKYVERNIGRYSGLSVGWFGGEPLVGMDALSNLSEHFLEICRKHRKTYIANVTTNGYLLDYEMEQRLKRYHVTSYQITIDGTRETHDVQKPLAGGGKTFDYVISNLMEIKEKEKSELISFSIRTNVSKKVLDNMEDYISFFGERFGDDSRFRYFFRPVMDFGGERVHNFAANMVEESALLQAYRIIDKKGEKKIPGAYEHFLQAVSGLCYAAQMNSFVIDPNGNVLKCTCNLDVKECPQNKVGHVDQSGNLNLDDAKYAAWLNEELCQEHCFFAPNCLREACPAERIIHKAHRPSCPHEKENLADVLRMLDSQNDIFERLE